MKMKILHLSDLHFTANNISQDIVMSSLAKKIEDICKNESRPNILIVTGDIAYSGKEEEYTRAKEFIGKVAGYCQIQPERVFVIPGNHDVDRSKLIKGSFKWYYQFSKEDELTDTMTSKEVMSQIGLGTKAYYEFIKYYMDGKASIGQFGEYVSTVPFGDNGMSIKIVGLNSAIFCGYDGDDQKKLALGISQVNECYEKLDTDKDIVISCVHHPFECFHECDKTSLSLLERMSDIILSGHVHKEDNSVRKSNNSNETLFVTSGAAFEKRTTQNGFNIIEIDSDTLAGTVNFYKYLPSQHLWIPNRDINYETNGVFDFQVSKIAKKNEVAPVNGSSKAMYMVMLDGKFDDLNRDRFRMIEEHLKTVCKDLTVTVKKVESGSIKIYFETSRDISDSIKSELENIDGANVVEIKKAAEDSSTLIKGDKTMFHWRTYLKPEYLDTIQSPGATFTHSRGDELSLNDLYVSPNLKAISIGESANERVERVVNAESALAKGKADSIKVVIYGAETSGKSTLVKWWYKKYYDLGYIPVLLTGNQVKDISIDKIKALVQREFTVQYQALPDVLLEMYDEDRVVLMIDDFHKIRFTQEKYRANLIFNLDKAFKNIFLTGNDLMQLETYASNSGIAINILEGFARYQIIEFGPMLRYELIKKWNSIGSEEFEANELIRLNNETEKHVETIIGKSFVPSYPVYLLTILQAKEATVPQKPEYSVHGFYYELLINNALSKAVKNKADISLFYNYITEYSYFLFDQKIRLQPIFYEDFLLFHKKYCHDYKIDISPKVLTETLTSSKLLKLEHDTVSISYKYVYYFFVARYLANNIADEEIKNKVKLLCERLHRDEFASIVMFLTHLSKDQFILNQLLDNSRELFKDCQPIRLEDDVSFVNEMIQKLPEQVYQPIDVETIKQEELSEEEELVQQEREFDSIRDVYEYDIDEDISTLDSLSVMIKSMKTIEIIGQVTKKYWGELKAPQKYELAEETYMLGLRTLGFYFSIVGKDMEMLVDYLKHIYKKKNIKKSISKEDIDRASRNFLFSLCAMSTFGIIKRVTNSIGYEKLSGTFEDILNKHDYNSVKLIDASIKLDHNKAFPWSDLRGLTKDTDKNYLASIVLKHLVINYLYVFVTSEADKQRICQLVGIKMEQQRMIDATSKVKRETLN